MARESTVNPLNTQRRGRTPARVPDYEHRYEERGGDVSRVSVRRDIMNPHKHRISYNAGRSDYDFFDLTDPQMKKLTQMVSQRKESTIQLPKGKDYRSVTLSYESRFDHVVYEKRPKDENAWITTVRIPADAFRNMKTKSK